jgi:hypothetical protein
LSGKRKIILDCIRRTKDLGAFATNDSLDHFDLDFKRQAGREAVDLDFVGGDTLWLEEDLLSFFIRELNNFVLNRRAVARAHAFNDPGVER